LFEPRPPLRGEVRASDLAKRREERRLPEHGATRERLREDRRSGRGLIAAPRMEVSRERLVRARLVEAHQDTREIATRHVRSARLLEELEQVLRVDPKRRRGEALEEPGERRRDLDRPLAKHAKDHRKRRFGRRKSGPEALLWRIEFTFESLRVGG